MFSTAVAGVPSTAPPVGLLSVRPTVRGPFTSVSFRTETVKVRLASLAPKLSVPAVTT